MRAGLTPDQFWEYTPDEVMLTVELDHERRQEEDDAAAHYARIAIMPHIGKKTPKPEELKRLRKPGVEKPQRETREENVISLEDRRSAVVAARKRVPWDAGRNGKRSG